MDPKDTTAEKKVQAEVIFPRLLELHTEVHRHVKVPMFECLCQRTFRHVYKAGDGEILSSCFFCFTDSFTLTSMVSNKIPLLVCAPLKSELTISTCVQGTS